MALSDFRDKTKLKTQDGAQVLSDTDVDSIVVATLEQFSKDCPYIKVSDISGDGGYDYSLPTSWQDGFSSIKKVEYPAGEREPVYLEPEDWIIYDNGISKKLRLLNHTPTASEMIRLTYTIAYLQTTIDNIPAGYQDAFCNLAASICCEAIANYYTQASDSTVDIDSIDYLSKSGDWGSRAKRLRKLYEIFLSNREGLKAASATGDWDNRPSWGDDHLLHSSKTR